MLNNKQIKCIGGKDTQCGMWCYTHSEMVPCEKIGISKHDNCMMKNIPHKPTPTDAKDWELEFEKEFPPFRGVGAQFPIFNETPNRNHIVQFFRRKLAQAIKENNQYWLLTMNEAIRNDVKAEREAWLEGQRCTACGKEIDPDPTKSGHLTDTCADCFENS